MGMGILYVTAKKVYKKLRRLFSNTIKMDSPTLNTLSEDVPHENEKYGHSIVKVQSVSAMTLPI